MSTGTVPSDEDCVRILTEAGCTKRVIVHCCTVRAVAEEIAGRIPCDTDLVVAGAILHDLGRAKDHSIMHAIIGADMARELGLPEEIVAIIRKHTGAGLDDQDADEMGIPRGDYIPATIEEKIVAHADNMVSNNRLVPHTHSVEKLMDKGAVRGANRIEELHVELSKIYGEDLDVLVGVLGEYPRLKCVTR